MSTSQSIVCRNCGAPASGNFCSACGATLTQRSCPQCQAELSPQARFCHRCGHSATGAARPGSDRTAWLVAAVVCVILISAIIYKVTADARQPAAPNMANVGSGVAGTPAGSGVGAPQGPAGTPPDISQLTPRESFDRLFNRIMTAAERGDRGEVEKFTPMALSAYSLLEAPDADARYHAAVLHLQIDDAPAALALADTILAQSPNHLFGYIIRGTAADMRKDPVARRMAQQDFLSHYDAEMKANRVEYIDHRPVMDEFKREAEASARTGSR